MWHSRDHWQQWLQYNHCHLQRAITTYAWSRRWGLWLQAACTVTVQIQRLAGVVRPSDAISLGELSLPTSYLHHRPGMTAYATCITDQVHAGLPAIVMRLLSLTSMMWLRANDWVSLEFGFVTSGRMPLQADNTSPRRTDNTAHDMTWRDMTWHKTRHDMTWYDMTWRDMT